MERNLWLFVDIKLKVSQQCTPAARRANCTLECLRYSTASWSWEGIVLLYSMLVGLYLEYSV